MTTMICSVLLLVMAGTVASETYPDCNPINPNLKSRNTANYQIDTMWRSNMPVDTLVYWVNFEGKEISPSILPAGDSQGGKSFPGHSFRVRTYGGKLIKEITADAPEGGTSTVTISPCGNIDAELALYPEGKDKLFESLIIDRNCDDLDTPSSEWGCARTLTMAQRAARNPDEFGFSAGEGKEIGKTIDYGYVRQIASIPKVFKEGPGYLLMEMPDSLKKLLLPWFDQNRKNAEAHEHIPGGYTNNEILGMTKLNLDKYPDVRAGIIREMTQILQWWCDMRLRHTSTYGVRIYRRDSMLINHVDRMDTHLASAVLQVAQSLDRDGGWPLEVLLPNKTTGEVYLQPGQMVLYEGAWLRHGRPMRFKGDEFANIFTHFAPISWKGPNRNIGKNDPLPNIYHGYEYGRCNTPGDDASSGRGCTVTDAMEAEWMAARGMTMPEHDSHDEL